MRILIAGCGYVGSALGAELAQRGESVWGLKRRPEGLPPGIQPIAADLSDPSTLKHLPENLDWVIYSTGAQAHDEAAYRAAYVEGPENLIGALREQGQRPRIFAYTSSTGVYSEAEGGLIGEEAPTQPDSATAKILVEGEQTVLTGPFAPLILRIAGIYGPGREGSLRLVRDGAITQGGEQFTNRIHREDIVGAIVHLLGMPQRAPIYNLADSEPAKAADVTAWLAQRLGLKLLPPAGATGSVATRAANKRVSNARLIGAGYELKYPTFREGLESLMG